MDYRSDTPRARIARSPADPAVTEDTRRRLGPWLLERVIGSGSMTAVWRARAANAAQGEARYAIKILSPVWQEDALAVEYFRREATVGRLVSHPHLVSVLSAQTAKPPFYLVMPYLAGRTVKERLQRGEPFPLPHALWIARQAAEALEAVHRAGYVHGDVKPGNLMISADGHATLLDLGFVRERAPGGSALDRPVAGTINYLAPEMLTSIWADERADLFSLGATLFEMLAGRPPYVASSLEELAEKQQRAGAPDVRSLVPHVPSHVAELVRSLLARDPFRRPRRTMEVFRRLITLEIGTLAERIPA
jgi:serine/threonine-protein kinase